LGYRGGWSTVEVELRSLQAGSSSEGHGRLAPLGRWCRGIAVGVSAIAVSAGAAPAAAVSIVAYPSSETILPSGPLPPEGSSRIVLDAALGEREGAFVAVSGASLLAVSVDRNRLGPIVLDLSFAHFVAFGSHLVPDALLPWDGSARRTEQANQPFYVQVEVPYGTKPGAYSAALLVKADDRTTAVPLSVHVFPVVLPRPGARGSMPTSFHVSPESYVAALRKYDGVTSATRLIAANDALYSFFARERISPASWGFGEPRTAAGYASNGRWWLDSLDNMTHEMSAGSYSALRIPISNNRTAPDDYIGGLSPLRPEGWCSYLRSVHTTWETKGWLGRGAVPYLYAYDEPGPAEKRLVARQALAAHTCFPGARVLTTTNPSLDGSDRFLWDGRGHNDLDAWAILSRRYYGIYAAPSRTGRARVDLRAIDRLRRRGKSIWAYTYAGPGTPGFLATEPLSDPRMFLLWTSLEGVDGVLYGEGTTSYRGTANPLDRVGSNGEFVLVYPGPNGPIPSARLEQIRDGIEDWQILRIVRRRHGGAAVRAILGGEGLFSAGRAGVRLACSVGCELHAANPFSWPQWSHDASTPRSIERAHAEALRLAASGP
jgi:Glycoside hydrolase 123, catalytic domain